MGEKIRCSAVDDLFRGSLSLEALLRLAVMVIGVLLTASVILLVLTLTILFRRNIIIRKL